MSPRVQDLAAVRCRMLDVGISLIGESPAFIDLLQSIDRVARHDAITVLIQGETGTGKELIARAIHYLGSRGKYPFVPVNCGALPEALAENELFGHRAGAFTGATHESVGLIRLADEGTLFLDEVDSLPLRVQIALLRFLQDGRYRPLGAAREERANVRIVAASNRYLEDEIHANRFRADLFYRLNLLAVQAPPLRARSGDVPILTGHFLSECARRYTMPSKSLHERTLSWFETYGWPGNVRELENLLHREYLLSDGEQLRIAAPAGSDGSYHAPLGDIEHLAYRAAKACALEHFDREYLVRLLRRTDGNVTKAAKLAGKERRALGKLLKRYQITHAELDGGAS